MKPLLAVLLLTSGLTHAVDIPLTIGKPGNVSVAVYDAQGRLVRELSRAQPMTAGAHTLKWDSLDRQGIPQPPGSYTWKMLGSPGLEARFLGVVGVNPVVQPYDPWVGNNDGPSAVAWD